jgi:hypothetical protein
MTSGWFLGILPFFGLGVWLSYLHGALAWVGNAGLVYDMSVLVEVFLVLDW